MKRRDVLRLAACNLPVAPADEQKWNDFAQEANKYRDLLQKGVRDLKQWDVVLEKFMRLK